MTTSWDRKAIFSDTRGDVGVGEDAEVEVESVEFAEGENGSEVLVLFPEFMTIRSSLSSSTMIS